MTYTEQDVERVAKAIWDSTEQTLVYRSVVTEDDAESWEYATDMHAEYRQHARAALEAMAPEPLEDVLRAQHVYNIQIEPAGPNFYAEVVSAAHDRRTGTGATIELAIRNAVAAAQGEKA